MFNESTIDFFIHRISENKEGISRCKGKRPYFIQRMVIGALSGKNEFFTELIHLKNKTELLMPMNYYLENPEEFLMFID